MKKNEIELNFWLGKKVLITGHTGFKGSWLCIWLIKMGAEVYGISLENTTSPNIFNEVKIDRLIDNNIFDIRDKVRLEKKLIDIKPDIIFHMAAQPLVLDSYLNPLKTWETNVMGTYNLLNSLRNNPKRCACIIITTDKVYKNNDNQSFFKESDPLGGFDPYSSSKAACEIAVQSFRSSFCGELAHQNNHLFISTVRSGNVIGGGDWSKNRIVPDIIQSIVSKKSIILRKPNSVRPWQHVLDPLRGYLILAQKLFTEGKYYATSFNFGPQKESNKSVLELVTVANKFFKINLEIKKEDLNLYESNFLALDISKAKKILDWEPIWDFNEAVEKTFKWYKNYYQNPNMTYEYCKNDLKEYLKKFTD